jgi:hypothetical protein
MIGRITLITITIGVPLFVGMVILAALEYVEAQPILTSDHDLGARDGSRAPGTSCPWHGHSSAYCDAYNVAARTVHCGTGYPYDCNTVGTNDGSRDAWDSSVTRNNQFENYNHNCMREHSRDYCNGYHEGYEDVLSDRFS